MIKALSGAKKPIRELRPDVPEELEKVIHRMMEPDPDDRYQDIQEVIDALGAIIQKLTLTRQS